MLCWFFLRREELKQEQLKENDQYESMKGSHGIGSQNSRTIIRQLDTSTLRTVCLVLVE